VQRIWEAKAQEAVLLNNFMPSQFGQYQGGIKGVQGLAETGANIGKTLQQGMSSFGSSMAEGIKTFNENSAKSDAANAKIQMLGQAYADKIAMYSKDPEIAQSGLLDSLIAKKKMLEEAPTKGLNQRIQIAHDVETYLAGFGNQLQEWSFLRGREMERVSEEGLRRLAGESTVTSPRFSKAEEFKADPNLTLEENKAKALGYLNKVRALNPKLKGTDQDFLANWLSTAEQDIAKADPTKVHPTVISSMLEQIQADKRIQKSNADANKTGLVEDFLARGKMSSKTDYDKTMTAAADVLNSKIEKKTVVPVQQIRELRNNKEALEKDLRATFGTTIPPYGSGKERDKYDSYVSRIENLNNQISQIDELGSVAADAQATLKVDEEKLARLKAKQAEERQLGFFKPTPSGAEKTVTWLDGLMQNETKSLLEKYSNINPKTGKIELDKFEMTKDVIAASNPVLIGQAIAMHDWFNKGGKSQAEKKIIKDQTAQMLIDSGKLSPEKEIEILQEKINNQKATIGAVKTATASKGIAKVAPIPMGEVVLGSMEETKKRTVAERQREVADFVTSRMGAIDPTDPEKKRRLPVAGFDKFYKSLVPESEIREFTTDSGIRMVYANGKWEHIKSADKMTPAEIRKGNIGVFGKQTADGRLVPSEFIPDSGIYIGGLFSGSDSAVDKYQEEMPKLIDARRGVKVLREINDQMGESLSPTAQGRALVEEMNLSAMLRTDIVGVGTVSNYEQQLIKKVTENAANFFSLESKDRAILIALAERVDRRIKNLSAAHGLTVRIEDDRGSSKYQALREQYLKEKGLL
jgi:hypothetical protein